MRRLCVSLVVCCGLAAAQVAKDIKGPMQLTFSAESQEVKSPVLLPAAAVAALAHDAVVHSQLGEYALPPPEWLSASKLRPVSKHENIYLVEAEGELRGANVTTFWLVKATTDSDHAEILWTSPAHDVQICYSKKSLYPIVSTLKFSAASSWGAVFIYGKGRYTTAYARQGNIPHDLPLPYCPVQSPS